MNQNHPFVKTITLEGMQFNAPIGYHPEEQMLGSDIEVSVKIATNSKSGNRADDIRETINYEDIYAIIKEVLSQHTRLLETAAEKIITALSGSYSEIVKVTVRIAKLNPPLSGRVNKVWVEDNWVRAK